MVGYQYSHPNSYLQQLQNVITVVGVHFQSTGFISTILQDFLTVVSEIISRTAACSLQVQVFLTPKSYMT